jgi:hypothetical protein
MYLYFCLLYMWKNIKMCACVLVYKTRKCNGFKFIYKLSIIIYGSLSIHPSLRPTFILMPS